MKSNGIVRKLDKLGRITLPIELCKKLEIIRGTTHLEFLTHNGSVILKQEEKPACVFCKRESRIIEHKGKHICRACLDVLNNNAEVK